MSGDKIILNKNTPIYLISTTDDTIKIYADKTIAFYYDEITQGIHLQSPTGMRWIYRFKTPFPIFFNSKNGFRYMIMKFEWDILQ